MDLGGLLKLVDQHVKWESAKRSHRFTDDLLQEVRLAAWLRMRSGLPIGPSAVRAIVRNKMVDEIRKNNSQRGGGLRTRHLSLRDWQSVHSRSGSAEDALQAIPFRSSEERMIGEMLASRMTIREIGQRMGLSVDSARRRVVRVREFIWKALHV